ncbi:MAG: hypothetical protein WDO18_04345 [Acidobacteriota bacterium]
MAKNEDGEFELVLGNNQLLSVFVLVVLLLGVCFVGGYFLGRKATPLLTAASAGGSTQEPRDVTPAKIVDATKPEPESKVPEAPERTAPQAPTDEPVKPEPKQEAKKAEPQKSEPKAAAKAPEPAKAKPEPVKAKAEPPKPEPVKAKPEPPKVEAKAVTKGSTAGQPIPGRIYLQLSATEKDKADVMVDLLRRRNLPGFAAAIPDRPGLFRVLVGPLSDNGVVDMKAQLKTNGFPADEAIRRTF